MKKAKKGFSLVEVLFAVVLLSLISLFFIPSLRENLTSGRAIKETADISFSLQEALEISRDRDLGTYTENINGRDIDIIIESYTNPKLDGDYKKIRAIYEDKSFELIEDIDEKGL